MTDVFIKRHQLVGTGIYEQMKDGRRYRFTVEKYRDDSGADFARIVEQVEVPNVGPILMIPPYELEATEADEMLASYEYELHHPNPIDVEQRGIHEEQRRRMFAAYDDARDARAEYINKHPATFKRST